MNATGSSTKNRNAVVVSHKYVTGPDDDLVIYLNGAAWSNVLHIRHSFSSAKDRRSFCSWYKDGKLFREYRSGDWYKGLPEPLLYVKEMWFTGIWVLKSGLIFDRYVGLDGLCVLFGNVLRAFGRAERTVYWAIDFVPAKRFSGTIRNKIYEWVNISGYRNADEMWDLSPKMAPGREEYLGFSPNGYRSHRIVQYGVWTDRIRKYSYEECERNTLVYMGHIHEESGVQLVIRAMPEILRRIPDFRFKVIGGGPYLETLTKMAEAAGVADRCRFTGKVDSIEVVEDEIAKSALAIAPYIKALDKLTRYADPGKVKTYLGCGVPLLLTDIPWNAGEIAASHCGKIIAEDAESIASAVVELMDERNNRTFRTNALIYSQRFNYANIFTFLEEGRSA